MKIKSESFESLKEKPEKVYRSQGLMRKWTEYTNKLMKKSLLENIWRQRTSATV